MRKWIAAVSTLALVIGLGLSVPAQAWATTLWSWGIPVEGIGSTTQAIPNCPSTEGDVCYDTTSHRFGYYIPLSEDYSGVFGVTDVPGSGPPYDGKAGTISDSGSGTGTDPGDPTALTMYIMYTPVYVHPSTAELRYYFTDLDLVNVSDPSGFFEAVQFFDADGNEMSSLITINSSYTGSPFDYTITGDNFSQTIIFPDITSIVTDDPFYAALTFKSEYNSYGYNTKEKLKTKLITTEPMPEPASLLLLGSGLAGLGLVRRRKRA